MPTGTRSSISANSATKPMTATASVLTRPPRRIRHCEERSDEAIQESAHPALDCFASLAMTVQTSFDRLDLILAAQKLRAEDQPVGAHGDQQNRGDVAEPSDQKERPGRQPQIEGQNIVAAR